MSFPIHSASHYRPSANILESSRIRSDMVKLPNFEIRTHFKITYPRIQLSFTSGRVISTCYQLVLFTNFLWRLHPILPERLSLTLKGLQMLMLLRTLLVATPTIVRGLTAPYVLFSVIMSIPHILI
jgi:hypothetical protein